MIEITNPDYPAVAQAQKSKSVEVLRNGHAVSKCGVATLEYLFDYASRRGIEAGSPTPAGKKQHGKHVSLLVVDGKLVRADFTTDIRGNRKLRRLSPRKFVKLCDALATRNKTKESTTQNAGG